MSSIGISEVENAIFLSSYENSSYYLLARLKK